MSKAIKERIETTLKTVRDIAAKAEAEDRDFTPEERAAVDSGLAEASALKTRLDGSAAISKALADFGADVEALDPKPAGSTIDTAKARALKGRSLGRAFMEDDAVSAYLKGLSPAGGNIAGNTSVHTPAVAFDGLKGFGYTPGTGRPKAVVTGASATSGGALVDSDFLGLVDEGTHERPLTVLDVLTRGQTDSDTVEYVRVTSATNNAAPVPEASTAGAIPDPDSENTAGVKPESALALARISTPVVTIAHWIPATKRALSDAGQVRTLIDAFLRYGLFEELEDQIVNGDGSGENFTGILNTSGVQSQAWDTDILTTTRKAKTKVRLVGRSAANAYMLHPNDAETLDLLKDNEGRFYFGGPADDGIQRLWRLPVVESEAVPEGTGIVADWRRAVLWDREQAAVSATDSHADFFIRNLVAILAELRAAFGITRPTAFVTFATSSGASS